MTTDELASKISWEPTKDGQGGSRKLKSKKVSELRIDFTPTKGFTIFSLFFFVSGLTFLSLAISGKYANDNGALGLWITSSAFTLAGGYLLFLEKNFFSIQNLNGKWKVTKNSLVTTTISLNPDKGISAIQILEKNADGFQYYELNLVYEDASRENILNQSDYESTNSDGLMLGEFLKVPVWNNVKRGKKLSKWGKNWDAAVVS